MQITTSDEIPGATVAELVDVVEGSVVVTKHVGRDFAAGFKSMFGGELKGYSEMLEEARWTARSRMIEAAAALGADAVIVVRYTTSAIAAGASEVLCYGTAVRFTS